MFFILMDLNWLECVTIGSKSDGFYKTKKRITKTKDETYQSMTLYNPIHKFIDTLNDTNSTKSEIISQYKEIHPLLLLSSKSSTLTDDQKEYLKSIQHKINERLYWR